MELILRSMIWGIGCAVIANETEILGHALFKDYILSLRCIDLKFLQDTVIVVHAQGQYEELGSRDRGIRVLSNCSQGKEDNM